MREQFGRDFYHLPRRLTGAKNNFRKPFAQGTMRVYLREAKVRDRCHLKCVQHVIATYAARAKFLQQSNGFGSRHASKLPRSRDGVTLEKRL